MQQARVEYEAFQITLYASHPELKTQRGQSPALSADQAGALLVDSHSALLEYVVTSAKTFLFVITRKADGTSDVRSYTLNIKETELAARAEQFRRQLAGRDLEFRGPARELYDLLLGPAQEQLAGKDALVIIPDGALWNLPFQALMTKEAYLIERQAVAYAPSLTALSEMRRQHKRRAQTSALCRFFVFASERAQASGPPWYAGLLSCLFLSRDNGSLLCRMHGRKTLDRGTFRARP